RRPMMSDLIGGVVYAAVPVMRGGQLKYLLTAALDPSAMVGGLLAVPEVPTTRIAVLIDPGKVVIARSPGGERLVGTSTTPALAERSEQGPEGSFQDVNLDGTRVYVGFHRSPLTGWTVAVGVPTSVVNTPLWQRLGAVLVVGLALIGVGMAGAWWFERSIRQPIVALSDAAERLAEGSPPRPVPSVSILAIAPPA